MVVGWFVWVKKEWNMNLKLEIILSWPNCKYTKFHDLAIIMRLKKRVVFFVRKFCADNNASYSICANTKTLDPLHIASQLSLTISLSSPFFRLLAFAYVESVARVTRAMHVSLALHGPMAESDLD